MAQQLETTSQNHGEEPETSLTLLIEPTEQVLTTVMEFLHKHPIFRNDMEQERASTLHKKKVPMMKGKMAVPPKSQCDPGIKQSRDRLPAFNYREKTLEAISNCSVVIVSGGTGCGKTTQIPQFILEEANAKQEKVRILVTQPRRIAAISIAERVAEERGENIGDTVGYQVRLESKKSDETLLTYCTTGVLLRMLTSDPKANGITHIVMDEIHEREINTDYLLIALRVCLQERKDLKIILMSATIEGSMALFRTYFGSFSQEAIEIESKLFDVKTFHLDEVLAMTGYEPPEDSSSIALLHFEPEKWMSEIAQIKMEQDQKKTNCELPYNRPMILQMFPNFPKSVYLDGICYQLDERQSADMVEHESRRASMPPVLLQFAVPVAPMSPQTPKSELGQVNDDAFGYDEKHKYAELIEKKFKEEMKSALPNRTTFYHPMMDKQVAETDFEKLRLAEKYEMFYGVDYVSSINHHLVDTVVKYLADSQTKGSILVFLPGYDDIQEMILRVSQWQNSLTNMKNVVVFPLHSQMHNVDYSEIFKPASDGTRKIILSTNIAEASITIEDVVFVVDTGRAKQKSYDHETMLSALSVNTISKSSATQRSGRAGRVNNGYCFRLFSEKEYSEMADTEMAEIKRAAIYEVALQSKILAPANMKIAEFLTLAPEPPSSDAIHHAMQFLEQVGALYSREKSGDEDPEITNLGRLMARLPLDPNLSRMLLFGLALKCLTPIVNLVAMLANRDPFLLTSGKEREDQKRRKMIFAQQDFSDHLVLIRICSEYCEIVDEKSLQDFCQKNFLSMSTMRMVRSTRRQLLLEIIRANLVRIHKTRDVMTLLHDRVHNQHADSWPMVQAAIAAGCYPAVGVRPSHGNSRIQAFKTRPSGIHPSSTVKQVQSAKRLDCIAFQELCQTTDSGSVLMKMVTAFPSITALLFTGPIRTSKEIVDALRTVTDDGAPTTEAMEELVVVKITKWYSMTAKQKTLRHLMQLREQFMRYFVMNIGVPTRFGIDTTAEEHDLLKVIRELLEEEHRKTRKVQMPVIQLVDYARASSRKGTSRAANRNRSLPVTAPVHQNQVRFFNPPPQSANFSPPIFHVAQPQLLPNGQWPHGWVLQYVPQYFPPMEQPMNVQNTGRQGYDQPNSSQH